MPAGLPAIDLPRLAHRIAGDVREVLLRRGRDAHGGETLSDPDDLKSGHAVDRHAARAARRALGERRCNIHIEGEARRADPEAGFCVYIDPLDGSLNWDRGVGDPAFVLAAAPGPAAASLDDLAFAYVEGLHSGDCYYTREGRAVYRHALAGDEVSLDARAPVSVASATGYIRCGYGGARRQLEWTLPLLLAARDLRAIDNAGTEFCEIARNAAHFMVEARGLSDGYNLLAWPIVRAAGGALLDLEGGELAPRPFDPAAPVDYVLAGSRALADDVVARMREGREAARRCLATLVPARLD